MSNKLDRQLATEARLLRRKSSYRGSLVGSVFLSLLFLAIFILVPPDAMLETDVSGIALGMFLFWTLAAAYCNARLDHIETIARHREDLAT
jgi:hypothetical protein